MPRSAPGSSSVGMKCWCLPRSLRNLGSTRQIPMQKSAPFLCAVSVRRILRSYWDGSACLDLPFQEALAVDQHNQEQMRDVLATYHPDVVAF